MYISKFFMPTLKDAPKDASIASHKLMLRSGMIKQLAAGIYNWLPLGLKVMQKIESIVRAQMNNIGAQELLMPCIQPIDLWIKSGRFGSPNDLTSEMLKITDRHNVQLTFTPTAEEVIVDLFKHSVQSYKALPTSLYQIAWKFRDEIRPRFGVMRAREFNMKDAYSFHANQECALNTYKDMLNAYIKAYKAMGLIAIAVKADTGAIGGDYSHEFHILADTGESEIFFQQEALDYITKSDALELDQLSKFYAAAKEKHDPINCPVPLDSITSKRGIEVGHLFYLGDKYTKALDCKIQTQDGSLIYPLMGCYGLGISRLIGAVIEANHDEHGIIWPKNISPFDVGLINLNTNDEKCNDTVFGLYDLMRAHNLDVLLDDSSESIGIKLSRMDLIGLPYVVIVGPRSLENNSVELKNRKTMEVHQMSIDALKNMLLSI